MAEISIGAAVGEGFELIRRKPLSVVAWGLIQILVGGLAFALFSPLILASFGELARQAQTGVPSAQALSPNVVQMQSLGYLFDLGGVFANAVFYCAIFRAVIHPEQSRFAYLRVGAAELLVALLFIGTLFAFGIGVFVAMLAMVLLVGILMVAHAGFLGGLVGLAAFIASLVGGVYLVLRLSMVGPMLVDEGKLQFTDAWALTRGKVWSLFAVALVVFLIILAGELVIGLVMVAIGLGMVSSAAGGLRQLPTFFQQSPQAVIAHLAPLLVVMAVVWVPLSGCVLAITGAPWARVYLDLRPKRDIAETFA
jgi:hypothetical protein